MEDIFRWAIALEFAEFGIDPTEIKKILDMNWPRLAQAVLEPNGDRDKYLFFNPNLLGRLSREEERETPDRPGAPYSVTIAIISDLGELDQRAKTDQARASLDRYRARYGMINLSRLRRQVERSSSIFPRFANETFRGATASRGERLCATVDKQAARSKERFPNAVTLNVA